MSSPMLQNVIRMAIEKIHQHNRYNCYCEAFILPFRRVFVRPERLIKAKSYQGMLHFGIMEMTERTDSWDRFGRSDGLTR